MRIIREKYWVPSLRHPSWDYRSPASYFITICTRKRVPWFGEIRHGIVGLTDAGCIVAEELQKTPNIRNYVELDSWIVMPNHVHAIIRIFTVCDVDASRRDASTTIACIVFETSTDVGFIIRMRRLSPQSIGSIINQYKSVCTKRIRAMGASFSWQPRFYDHIIRSERELGRIRDYIRNNPRHTKCHLDDDCL